MNAISKKILNHLLDKYENSKSFHGDNKIKQTFSVETDKLFKKYSDAAEHDYFLEVNDSVEELRKKGIVFITRLKNDRIQKIILNVEKLDDIYVLLGRTSKKEELNWLEDIWNRELKEAGDKAYIILTAYITAQIERISKNKTVEYYDSGRSAYQDFLKAIKRVLLNETEVYIRDFSMEVFGYSRRLEQIKGKVQAFLFAYGDYEEKEHVLEECGIVSTPTYVAIKGNGQIKIGSQVIALSELNGDIALSSETIKDLSEIQVLGNRVVTIENMISFQAYSNKDDFVIYLGNFHNRVKRELIQCIFLMNQTKSYYHFGDIDAGGFCIFEHLCSKTGVNFKLLDMSIEILERYTEYWKPLTGADKKRIRYLIERLEDKEASGQAFEDYRQILHYMLENNCKLERV